MSKILSLIEVTNADIFCFCSQSLLRNLTRKIIKASIILKFGSNIVLAFIYDIDLTIYFVYICYGLIIGSIVLFSLTINIIDF